MGVVGQYLTASPHLGAEPKINNTLNGMQDEWGMFFGSSKDVRSRCACKIEGEGDPMVHLIRIAAIHEPCEEITNLNPYSLDTRLGDKRQTRQRRRQRCASWHTIYKTRPDDEDMW